MESNMLFPYLFGFGLSFLIGVFITRAIFSIPAFLRIQKAKLHVLTEIALKQGVKADILKTIYLQHEIDTRNKSNEEMRAELEASKKA